MTDQDEPRDRLAPGTHIVGGAYKITKHLRDGGMGELYLGEETAAERMGHGRTRRVAIKAIKPELIERKDIRRAFIDEANRLGDLHHQSIVRYGMVHDDVETGRLCMIMEFIEGPSLKDYLAQHRPLHPQEVKLMAQSLCSALSYVHGEDQIHRDLSPDNVMLRDGDVAKPVLIDFGIGRSVDRTDASQNVERRFVGRYGYASPEQLGMFGGVVSGLSDIYSLALLIARAVLPAPLPMGNDLVSARDLREDVPDLSELPASLRPLLTYMLQPDPKDRPDSMFRVQHLINNPQAIPGQFGGFSETGDDEKTEFGEEFPEAVPGNGFAVEPVSQPGSPGPSAILDANAANQSSVDVGGFAAPPVFGGGGAQATPVAPLDDDSDYDTEPEPPKPSFVRRLLIGVSGLGVAAALGVAAFVYFGPYDPEPSTGGGPPGFGLQADITVERSAIERLSDIRDPLQETRLGLLSQFVEGECTFAHLGESTGTQGRLVLFGLEPPNGFSAALREFATVFGDVAQVDRQVAEPQCPVLRFARASAGRGATQARLVLIDPDIPRTEALLTVRLDRLVGRQAALVAVSDDGRVVDLGGALVYPSASENRYRGTIPDALIQGAETWLLVAIVSNEPLTSMVGLSAETQAEIFFEDVAEELIGQSQPASVSIVQLRFQDR